MTTIIHFIRKLLRKPEKQTITTNPSCIISRDLHTVSKKDISHNAIKVLTRLNSAGYQAYLVGGGVRDLVLHKAPKDFDIATNATPNQIKSLFRNARIIGRRFKLVHILCHREIIEVATFRAHEPVDDNQQTNDRGMLIRDNVYGTLEDDAWRRDFTMNALYYSIDDGCVIDITGGFDDIRARQIRMIGDPETRYQEDPVRMLRAIRFSAKLQFKIADETSAPLSRLSGLIEHVSGSRLFDEMVKLYQCGHAESAQQLLVEHGLFARLFPKTAELFDSPYPVQALITLALQSTDNRIQNQKTVTPAFCYAVLLWFPVLALTETLKQTGLDAVPALEQAMSQVIASQNKIVTIPKRFTQVMREIWILQYRLAARSGLRPYGVMIHPRFRAAYDFLALRALADDAPIELAEWWTQFQEADADTKTSMIAACAPVKKKSRKKRKTIE